MVAVMKNDMDDPSRDILLFFADRISIFPAGRGTIHESARYDLRRKPAIDLGRRIHDTISNKGQI
jgi:hypothetical protein